MSNKFIESVLEYAAIHFFQDLGYTYFSSLDIADDSLFEQPARLKWQLREIRMNWSVHLKSPVTRGEDNEE